MTIRADGWLFSARRRRLEFCRWHPHVRLYLGMCAACWVKDPS